MFSRIFLPLLLLFVAGCTSGAGDTDTEQLRDILVPGYETPSRVLYSRGDSETCRAIGKRSLEVSDRLRESQLFLEGYSQVRVQAGGANYRAFFKPERVVAAPYEAAFIFCTNDSTPVSLSCSVIGVMRDGCFETGYAWYKISEIESLIKMIRSKAPKWSPSAAPNSSFNPKPLRSSKMRH